MNPRRLWETEVGKGGEARARASSSDGGQGWGRGGWERSTEAETGVPQLKILEVDPRADRCDNLGQKKAARWLIRFPVEALLLVQNPKPGNVRGTQLERKPGEPLACTAHLYLESLMVEDRWQQQPNSDSGSGRPSVTAEGKNSWAHRGVALLAACHASRKGEWEGVAGMRVAPLRAMARKREERQGCEKAGGRVQSGLGGEMRQMALRRREEDGREGDKRGRWDGDGDGDGRDSEGVAGGACSGSAGRGDRQGRRRLKVGQRAGLVGVLGVERPRGRQEGEDCDTLG
ncbi:hypothetical protein EDB84DRAFT_1438880 [Lactarius hengduanensis]|nr:hypothetical protein EDB84DRAFT_1438880 [Lactarius hengduanensis]